jgi:hypothetical protein
MSGRAVALVDSNEAALRRVLEPLNDQWELRFFARPGDALSSA